MCESSSCYTSLLTHCVCGRRSLSILKCDIWFCFLGSESSLSSQDHELFEDRNSVCVLKPTIKADISLVFYRGWMSEKCMYSLWVNKDRKEIVNNHTGGLVCSYNKYLRVFHVPCVVLHC